MRRRFPTRLGGRSTISLRTRATAALLVSVVLTVLFAGPARAHATLTAATPGDAAVVQQAPVDVTLTYDEAVGTQKGAVKVLAPDGTRVDTGEVTTSDGGRVVTAPLRAGLAEGTYTILWRVLSEDSHSIFGVSRFSVGQPSATVAGDVAAAAAGGGRAAEILLGVARFLQYAGLVLLIGGLGFVLLVWPAGRATPAVRRMLWTGWGLLALSTVAGLLLQGPYTAGASLTSVLDPTLIAAVLETRFGVATVVRLVLLAGSAVLLTRWARWRRAVAGTATTVLGAGVLLSVSALGHSGAGDLVVPALLADALHLAAMATWLGGLIVLALVLLKGRPVDAAELLPRWSRLAMTCVGLLVVTGTFTAWRQVRFPEALVSTRYGVVLLVKLALVVLILGLAAAGRHWVLHHLPPVPDRSAIGNAVLAKRLVNPDGSAAPAPGGDRGTLDREEPAVPVAAAGRAPAAPDSTTRLRRRVVAEAAVAAVILAVTSILVATTPARDTYFPVFEQALPAAADLQVDVTVDPARTGPNDLRFRFSRDGDPADVVKVTARWTSQDGDYVVPAELVRTDAGEYRFTGLLLPSAGTWKVAVTTQTSDIDAHTVVVAVPLR